jgi:hypothetical protein
VIDTCSGAGGGVTVTVSVSVSDAPPASLTVRVTTSVPGAAARCRSASAVSAPASAPSAGASIAHAKAATGPRERLPSSWTWAPVSTPTSGPASAATPVAGATAAPVSVTAVVVEPPARTGPGSWPVSRGGRRASRDRPDRLRPDEVGVEHVQGGVLVVGRLRLHGEPAGRDVELRAGDRDLVRDGHGDAGRRLVADVEHVHGARRAGGRGDADGVGAADRPAAGSGTNVVRGTPSPPSSISCPGALEANTSTVVCPPCRWYTARPAATPVHCGDLALNGEQVGLHHVRVGRRRLPGDHGDAGTAHPEEVRAERAAGDGVLHGGVAQVAGGCAGVPPQEGRTRPASTTAAKFSSAMPRSSVQKTRPSSSASNSSGDAVGVGHDVLRERDEVVHPHPDPGEHDPRVVGRLACSAEGGLQGEDQARAADHPVAPDGQLRLGGPVERSSGKLPGISSGPGSTPSIGVRLGSSPAAEPQREPGPSASSYQSG